MCAALEEIRFSDDIGFPLKMSSQINGSYQSTEKVASTFQRAEKAFSMVTFVVNALRTAACNVARLIVPSVKTAVGRAVVDAHAAGVVHAPVQATLKAHVRC